ncbi:hypothetical protein NQ314_007792 [Rhamnusium bicolor]|uniref:Organic solute transporter alpha-like protein n=1 Tax=Rhamnusium bicolor TaxID=1586634 RepID=A0AAV8YGS9_9CUCU|nr:hypothetical protein NQ314_007792 [Rhamnusium bicolor]
MGTQSSFFIVSATNVYGITLVTIGTMAMILVLALFIDTLRYIMKNSSPRVKAHSAFVIGVYPVTSLATYFAILVPRAHLLAEAITQGMFMAGMYQLFCLFVAYCGGEAELVKKVKPTPLSLKVGPCCCWPCCFILPTFVVSKKTVRTLRILVLQLPVVQGLVYLILLVMWAEREHHWGIMTGETFNNNSIICDNFNNKLNTQDKKLDSSLNGFDNIGADIKE